MFISIITPVYNRAGYLPILAESINKQKKDYLDEIEWIIVNDGSTDNITEVVEKLKSENEFLIKYIEKENGGKHTAINEGLIYCKGVFTLIVDSDDYFVDEAMDVLFYELKSNPHNINSFLYVNKKRENNFFKKEYYDADEFVGFKADTAIVLYTSLFKDNKFPVHSNEKFLTECVVWNKIISKYNIRCVNKAITTGEYLDGGLTSSYLLLLNKSPNGVFNLINTNMETADFSLNILKQTAYHFSSIFNFKNIIKLFRREMSFKSVMLVIVTIYVLLRKKIIK